MAKRRAVGFLMTERGFSERRACRIVGLARSVRQYRALPKDDEAAIKRMKELASENRRTAICACKPSSVYSRYVRLWFMTRPSLRSIACRRRHYNTKRPHSALGYLSPTEFLIKTTAPALETLAVSTLPLNTQTQPEDSRPNRP